MKKVTKAQTVREYMQKNPTATTAQIARACKVNNQYVYQVKADQKKKLAKNKVTLSAVEIENAKKLGVSLEMYAKKKKLIEKYTLPDGRLKTLMQSSTRINPLPITMEESRLPKFDNVNHPSHYTTGGIETIDFIEAKELDYHLGNVVKYITRAKHKGNELENLKKAHWYLDRKIENLTGSNK